MKITAELLESKQVCISQLRDFNTLFPHGVEPTKELCIAHAAVFDWDWAASQLLRAPAHTEYWRIRLDAYAEYGRACDIARAEHDVAEYRPICDAAYVKYTRTCAAAFGRLWRKSATVRIS